MNELDVVSVSCAFAELAFTWGSQVWELMGFVYRSPSHRPWALRAHLGEIVRNAHPFLELGFPARGFSLGQLVLWKQERQGPGCPLAPWSTFVQEVAEGRVPEGQCPGLGRYRVFFQLHRNGCVFLQICGMARFTEEAS